MNLDTDDFQKLSYEALNDLPVPVFWFDKTAKFIDVNKVACAEWGYSKDEFLQMSIFDVNPNMKPEMWDAHWENKINDPSSFETTHMRKDGKEFPVDITDNFVELNGSIYCCAIIKDITTRKRKEAALRGALMEIRELKEKLEIENNYLNEEIEIKNNFGKIITDNEAFKKVLIQVEQVANTSSTVLITGESGTGKELLVHAIHQLGDRSDQSIIKVNCAALPTNMIESELFGHEKGAFIGAIKRKVGKFQLADHGTFLLDEIGEIPLALQSKLLRVLQEGEFESLGSSHSMKVDVRIIATSNKDLQKEIEEGRFREDLFYRLNVFPIQTIPLRERKEDIPLLTRYFCDELGNKLGKKITDIPESIIKKLISYSFPGNVRELENLIERGVITSKRGKLNLSDFNPKHHKKKIKDFDSLENMQRKYITEVLQHTDWRVSGDKGASLILGIPPTTLFSKIKKLGIKRSNNAE